MDPACLLLAARDGGASLPGDYARPAALALAAFAVFVAIVSARVAHVLRGHGRQGAGLVLLGGAAWFPAVAAWTLLVTWNAGDDAWKWKEHATAKILLTFVVLAGTWLASAVADIALFAPGREAFGWVVPTIVREAARTLLLVVAVFFVLLGVWDVDFSNVAVLASALAVVLGIALGPTLGSLVAGITLTQERPFSLGDWIHVDGKEGRVEQITWRSTRIVTRDNESVVLPNSKLAAERIINLSRPDRRLGVRCRVGVHYRTPPPVVVEAIRSALAGTPRVQKLPEPVIRLVEYADSSMIFETRFWIDDPGPVEDIKSDFMMRVWTSFQRAGIEIPFPIRNLVMRDRGWEGAPSLTESQEKDRRGRNLELFRRVPIFAPLPEKSLEWLAAQARDEAFLEGEKVARQGEAGDRMFVIVAGTVRVDLEAGEAHEVGLLGPGEFFGEMSVLTGGPRTATVTAMGALRVASVRARDLVPVLQDQPEFARHLAEHAARRQVGLDELKARALAAGPAKDLETTSHDLLREIVRFFRLSGSHPPDPGRGGGGGQSAP